MKNIHLPQILRDICRSWSWPSKRQVGIVTCVLLATAVFVGYHGAKGQETMSSYDFSLAAQQGKLIAPVTLNLANKNPEIVYIGSYLVNSHLACNSCHTCPSYKSVDPFKSGSSVMGAPGTPGPINAPHYLAGGVPFPGRGAPYQGTTLASTNLTPDGSGLPGGLSYADFKSAMQNGTVSSKPGHVLQVMPWPVFRNLYEAEYVAIYEYLSAIPAAQPGVCTLPEQGGGD